MGVEPTGYRAERHPNRFEDGKGHRASDTSTKIVTHLARRMQTRGFTGMAASNERSNTTRGLAHLPENLL
jgi:hypothetical protein